MPSVNNNKTKTAADELLGTVDFFGVDGDNRQLAGQIRCYADAAASAGAVPGRFEFWVANSAGTLVEVTEIASTGKFGYSANGGTVTQLTNKSTGATLSKASGQVTMNNASLDSNTTVSFTLTNTLIAATDILVLNHVSGGTAGSYSLNAQCGAGSASINVRNITGAPLAEAIVIAFVLIKGVTS